VPQVGFYYTDQLLNWCRNKFTYKTLISSLKQ